MKIRVLIGILLVGALPLTASAQSVTKSPMNEQYLPRLGDIMNNIQLRHIKLSFAGTAQNWELAAYELRQLRAGLEEAAAMYGGIPVTNVVTMTAPIDSIGDAIAAKDGKRFAKLFSELTAGCNGCHQSMGRGYIQMRVPTEQPFSNQVFPPRRTP
ncbi:MAG: hypothetical protein Q7J60_16620 [Bradyrhizobium sp.]|nr:hypothetical protein [Bradyrhizobium sp.]